MRAVIGWIKRLLSAHAASTPEVADKTISRSGSSRYTMSRDEFSRIIPPLMLKYRFAVIDVERQLRFNYEMLRRAKEDGCEHVKIEARNGCACMIGISGKLARTDEMIAAFEGRKSPAPIIPPPELPCCIDGEIQAPCLCWVIGKTEWTLGEIDRPGRDDPEVVHRANSVFYGLKRFVEREPKPGMLPTNWLSIIEKNADEIKKKREL